MLSRVQRARFNDLDQVKYITRTLVIRITTILSDEVHNSPVCSMTRQNSEGVNARILIWEVCNPKWELA